MPGYRLVLVCTVLAALQEPAVGAEQPDSVSSEHWAFQTPVRPEVPEPENADWGRNPIDAFIAARLEEQGLRPVPPASRNVLLRRVYLDLVGLPPTPDELRAFLEDDSPDAYEDVVERLLASPQYGERWGRHWMDVWRYSDWYGYKKELRNSARHIWRWRDWIIESLNEDEPYNRMVLAMLAGDEWRPADRDTLRATGYLARNYYKFNRNTWLDATIEHTGKAFLGLTFNCARCHDHKYDPLTQRDYYRFRAFFEPHRVRTGRVPGEPDTKQDGLPRVYDADLQKDTYVFLRGNAKQPDKENPVAPALPAVLTEEPLKVEPVDLPPVAWYPGLRDYVQHDELAAAERRLAERGNDVETAQQKLAAAQDRLTQLRTAANENPPESKDDTVSLKGTPFLIDDLTKPRPELWKQSSGEWTYADGRLSQKHLSNERSSLVSVEPHPRDFTASVRLTITGGRRYKSVGLSFDRAGDERATSVYVSAHAPGPKVQLCYTRNGKTRYPQDARRGLPIRTGEAYTLRVDVRDRRLNAYLDGNLVLNAELPQPREPGSLALWTFDATAGFEEIAVHALSPDANLVRTEESGDVDTLAEGESAVTLAEAALEAAKKRRAAAEAELASVEARIAADEARYADPSRDEADRLARAAAEAERTADLKQAEAAVAAAEHELAKARENVKQKDGKKKEAVEKAEKQLKEAKKKRAAARQRAEQDDASYSPLTKTYPRTSSGRRLALARWIADDANPLTARVAVNHIWMRHFGKPLVPTVFDFGTNGQAPSHPRLLDWLAVEFVESGWSMKHLHKLIVTSAAYRMRSSGKGFAKNREIDPDNRLLWRMNSRRMEAELVRDSVLHVAGRLNLTMGGPELDSERGQTTYRRSVYYRHAPEKYMTFLKLFDNANAAECYRRDRTVVPQQALALSNSRLSLEQARLLARALAQETGRGRETDAAFINTAYRRILCRAPTEDERRVCLEFLQKQTERLRDQGGLAHYEAGNKIAVQAAGDPHRRARENLVHVLLNHNEFVTIR